MSTDCCDRIALLTDFGDGPYVGQMLLRLSALAPKVAALSLISDLPQYRPDLAGCLLPGLQAGMPNGTLYCCVVDPGVGSDRALLAARSGLDWWLGPDNGLLMPLLRIKEDAVLYRLRWRPERLSASFHGRDWFVPAAARLALGDPVDMERIARDAIVGADWPAQRACVCYVDAFGNLITGLAADSLPANAELQAGQRRLKAARTFSEVSIGEAFWYRNAFDLVEIAVNQGRADQVLDLGLGAPIEVCAPPR
jgi:S-adenosylmethionine hydrolase